MKNYDLLVIGTGAGPMVLDQAIKDGYSCAIIEKGKYGGTCLTKGCIPTKVLVTAADSVRDMQRLNNFGIKCDNPRMDWEEISSRVWTKIDMSEKVHKHYHRLDNVDSYDGTAKFIDENTVAVYDHNDNEIARMTASKIIINVGARTKIPNIEGLENIHYLTSERFFGPDYPKKPYKSLMILGGGPIGAEFAHIFAAVGTKVTMVQHNVRLLPKEDEDVSKAVLNEFKEFGIETLLNKDTISIREEKGKKILTIKDRSTGKENEVRADEILLATSVVSNADTLQLENTKIELDASGWVRTNEFLQTTQENVWAIGDVNGMPQFRHKANYEAEIVTHNMLNSEGYEGYRWADYSLVPAVTFTHTQAAHIGLTEKQARDKGYNVSIGFNNYSDTAKGYSLGLTRRQSDGFVKLVVDKDTGRLLGAHIAGHEASILIQIFVSLMSAGKQEYVVRNEDIGFGDALKFRKDPTEKYLDPKNIQSILEGMVPHPSLAEVAIWAVETLS